MSLNLSKESIEEIKKALGLESKEESSETGEVKIVVLQRGWVMVGYVSKYGSQCVMRKASVIRSWGTTKGLGEIAKDGPTSKTKLDPCNGDVDFHELTVVCSIKCERSEWNKHLK